MATIRIVLGIFCFALYGQLAQLNRNFLKAEPIAAKEQQILNIARSQLGVREATGKNDGPEVAAYLKVTGLKEGQPWCAAFVSWVFAKAGYAQPLTAWSPSLFPIHRQTKIIRPAHVFGVYFKALNRIAHAGLVEEQQGNWIVTIEGNSNASGSREGDGVYRKRRHIKTIKVYANWLLAKEKGLRP